MSIQRSLQKQKPVTVNTLKSLAATGKKIVSLTCYDYTTAKILDQLDAVDLLLVGDSLAMTVLGHPDTLSVTVDEMLHHVKAVSRACGRAFLVADMPFMSYHTSCDQAIQNAGRFIQEGRAKAVKLEGASAQVCTVITQLTQMGIPVMGHLGLTPQLVNTLGGFTLQGKTVDSAQSLLGQAKKLESAGVFAIVLEMMPTEVAALITAQLSVPTIGIGAGNKCSGQILVIDDLLGRYQAFTPRFVRQYADLSQSITQAVQQYASDLQSGDFPNAKESFAFETPDALKVLQPACALS
ncbi:MAG: 3-methyl-2-oxobutanoate hydroxymethyltransferase [Cyanobacteria bacterium P01_H01_bin.74]